MDRKIVIFAGNGKTSGAHGQDSREGWPKKSKQRPKTCELEYDGGAEQYSCGAADVLQVAHGGGWDLWLRRKHELKGWREWDKMEETCIRSEDVGKYISEFKAPFTVRVVRLGCHRRVSGAV